MILIIKCLRALHPSATFNSFSAFSLYVWSNRPRDTSLSIMNFWMNKSFISGWPCMLSIVRPCVHISWGVLIDSPWSVTSGGRTETWSPWQQLKMKGFSGVLWFKAF